MARLFSGQVSNGPKATYASQLDISDQTDCTITWFMRTPTQTPTRGYIFADMISSTNARFFIEWGNSTLMRCRVFTNYSSTSSQRTTNTLTMSNDTWYFCVWRRTGTSITASNWTFDYAAVSPAAALAEPTYFNTTNGSGTIAAAATETVVGNRGAGDRTTNCQVAYLRAYSESLSDSQLNAIKAGDFSYIDSLLFAPDLKQTGDGDDAEIPATVVFGGSPTPSAQPDPFNSITLPASNVVSLFGQVPTPVVDANVSVTGPAPVAVSFGAQAPTVAAGILVRNGFLTANLDLSRTSIANSGSSTPTITIFAEPGTNTEGATPTAIYNGFAGRITGVNGKTPTFVLAEDDPTRVFNPSDSSYRPWFTYDDPDSLTATWTRFANNTVSSGDLNFSHSSAFTQDDVYIAHRPRYSTAKARAFLDSIKSGTHVTMPPSSTGADHVHFTTTATTREDGTSLSGRELLSFRITNASAQPVNGAGKLIAVHIGGQHAGEDQGEWGLQNYVEYLLSGAADANELLRNFDHYFYPIINATGRDGGAYRGTLQSGQEGEDPNREWATGSLALEEVEAVRDAITADTSNNIDVFMDWHGRGSNNPPAIFAHPGSVDDTFVANVQAIMPAVAKVTSGETAGISTVFYRANYSPTLATTIEGDAIVTDIADYETFGEAVAQALDDTYQQGALGDTVSPLAPVGISFSLLVPSVSTPAPALVAAPSASIINISLLPANVSAIVPGENPTRAGTNLGKGVSYSPGVADIMEGVGAKGVNREA